jgi:hypothetical protein
MPSFLKKLASRNKTKSSWDLADATVSTLEVPKSVQRPSSFTFSPPPPPYVEEQEEDREISVSDLGSLLIGIDFGTT